MLTQTCKTCAKAFTVADEDLAFYEQVSPTFNNQKFPVLPPKLCPDCRFQQRLAFRNERYLYTRKCDKNGKSIITNFAPETPYKVFSSEVWWSDEWNALDYGRDFDFTKTFTEQFNELIKVVPYPNLITTNCENCDYANFLLGSKNSYLVFGGANDEDCLYGKYVVGSKDCVDNLAIYNCELCYECTGCEGCYNCKFALNSRNCSDSLMIDSCQSCKNCIGCFGLVSKEYYIFNKPYSKEEYEKIAKEYEYLTPQKISSLREKLSEISRDLPHRHARIFGSENCLGDNIYNSTNCQHCYDINECENSKFLNFSPKSSNTYDVTFSAPGPLDFCYNNCSIVGMTNCIGNYRVWYGNDIYYSITCHSSSNIFGCVGLKSKKYCILNKEYSPEEYQVQVAKIVEHMQKTGEWGEFLDYSLSCFGYNETIAQEYFPLNEQQAKAINAKWHDDTREKLEGAPQKNIPEDIRTVSDDITSKVFTCEITGRPYKIIPQELAFYRKTGLPIPHRHPDKRHLDRIALHTPYHLFDRTCSNCATPIQTTYSEEAAKIVYCEKCYLEAIY